MEVEQYSLTHQVTPLSSTGNNLRSECKFQHREPIGKEFEFLSISDLTHCSTISLALTPC